MIKNDWVYCTFIAFTTVFAPTLSMIIFFSTDLMEPEYDAITIPLFFLAILLPFWIGLLKRKAYSYKSGMLMGMKTSFFTAVLSTIPLILSIIYFNAEVKELQIQMALSLSMVLFIGLAFFSLIIPVFGRKNWKQHKPHTSFSEILDQ